MEQNLELLQSIGKNWDTCAKGFDVIEEAIDEISRKKNIGILDVVECALKIGAGGFISYVSIDSIKQNVVQLAENIEVARQPEIIEPKLEKTPEYSFGMLPFGLFQMNSTGRLYNTRLYRRMVR